MKSVKATMLVVGLVWGWMASGNAYAMGPKKPTPTPEPSPSPSASVTPIPVPADELKLGAIGVAGTGCVDGSAKIEVSQDKLEIRVLWDGMVAEILRDSQNSLVRKTCTIAIPVEAIAAGRTVVVSDAEVIGDYDLAAGVSAQASTEIFLAGTHGDIVKVDLGSADRVEQGKIRLAKQDAAATACGEAGTLRANTAVLVKKDSSSQARSSGARLQGLSLKLKVVPCAAIR